VGECSTRTEWMPTARAIAAYQLIGQRRLAHLGLLFSWRSASHGPLQRAPCSQAVRELAVEVRRVIAVLAYRTIFYVKRDHLTRREPVGDVVRRVATALAPPAVSARPDRGGSPPHRRALPGRARDRRRRTSSATVRVVRSSGTSSIAPRRAAREPAGPGRSARSARYGRRRGCSQTRNRAALASPSARRSRTRRPRTRR
jgi:hypothetical protein